MITRLKVDGFKNLVGVDVRFGPFTCIAGLNGAGKSNLFDAIRFLSLLASNPLLDAARTVRGGGRVGDLFYRQGSMSRREMSFEVEMIVPRHAVDDLGQPAEASSSLLRYRLVLGLAPATSPGLGERLAIREEHLGYITKGNAYKHLRFPHAAATWRESVVFNEKRGEGFISTLEEEGKGKIVRLHQDGGGSRGRPLSYLADSLPRTVLSSSNSLESPTALIARREMESWRLLQLEPAALRKADDFDAPASLGDDGAHLAATLYRLEHRATPVEARTGEIAEPPATNGPAAGHIYAAIGNRLAEFLDDVRDVAVERDDKRELLTLQVKTREGTDFSAPALSDGSLRFLALAILEIDPTSSGVICLEEPENGVHPNRIGAILELLQDLAVDLDAEVNEDNPLRQVIVNTHSPAVVQQVSEDALLVAQATEHREADVRLRGVVFRPLAGTWRAKDTESTAVASLGELLSYLHLSPSLDDLRLQEPPRARRVADRDDVQGLLFEPAK